MPGPTSIRYHGWFNDAAYKHLVAVVGGETSLATSTAANTARYGYIVGTPVVTALPDHSIILSSTVGNADIVLLSTRAADANSAEVLRVDSSAGLIVVNETGADWDFRIEGDTNANMFVIDAGADSSSMGAAVVAGAALALSNLTSRTLVTAVGHQLHIPAGSFTDSGVTGTIAVLAPIFVGARTILATNTITYTDVAAIRALIPIASTGATFTRTYAIWTDGQIRADSNFQVNNTATFGTTQPTASVVFQSGTAPAGTITTGGAVFSSATLLRKIIADGTASNIET